MLSDRASILNQVAAGQLSAEEAARRLGRPARTRADWTPEALAGRWLHVEVTNLATGVRRVSVSLPLTWVDIGLRIGARYRPDIAGLDWDELAALLQSGASGQLLEVEDLIRNERVQIFVE